MRITIFISICVLMGVLQSCKPDEDNFSDCFVPDKAVNLSINMDLPEYFDLQNLGGFYNVSNAGHRGIYIIHNYDDLFYAIERTCPYESDSDCAQVWLDNSILQLRCGQQVDTGFVVCCGSAYDFNSSFLSGPTRCNLKRYRVAKQGNSLLISN